MSKYRGVFMSKSGLTRLLLAGGLTAALSCQGADLSIRGSDTVGAQLAPALVRAWLQSQGYNQLEETGGDEARDIVGRNAAGKSLSVTLEAKGSSTGFAALQAGSADIAMASRPIKAEEVAALKSAGNCDTAACEYVLGLDGIAVIVNAGNPLTGLDTATLQRIFSGQVKEWKQLGGSGGAIHVVALDANSGTFDTFSHLVMRGTPLVASARRDASHAAIAQMVAADPGAIGFVGLPFVNGNKALAINEEGTRPITPSAFSVATEDYALSRRLFFYLPELSASDLARKFVDFSISDAGQQVVAQSGFVSQQVVAVDETVPVSAPEEYRQLTAGAQRLSLNFRFVRGMTTLDTKSQRDVERLKRFMSRPENKAKHLLLFGFADSNESLPIVSLQLSTDRADTVADLLARQGMEASKTRGYGSDGPVASNATEAGRSRNRRVEVWIR